jgi:hypothetical protein
MALYFMCFMGGTPVGAPLIGLVAEHLGAPWGLILGGAIVVVSASGAGLWLARGHRVRLEAHVAPPRLALHVSLPTGAAAVPSPPLRAAEEAAAGSAAGTTRAAG